MQRYPVRTSHRANLSPDRLSEIARTHFEGVEVQDGVVRAHFGAISSIALKAEGKELGVTLDMDPKVPTDVAAETIQHYNRFLEESTGYSSKERAKRLKKAATGPGGGE